MEAIESITAKAQEKLSPCLQLCLDYPVLFWGRYHQEIHFTDKEMGLSFMKLHILM